MNTIWALANVVIKELYRRKDFYVLFFLVAVITIGAASVNFFHDAKIVRYVKDLCLLLIWVAALVIAVVTTARQIPAERENRTIFPLLAKPVSRWQVIVGKFLGCWLATGITLLFFYTFFAVVSGSREQNWPVLAYLQAIWLQWVMLAIVIAMTLLGSVVLAAPSSASTICFVVVVAILAIGSHLNTFALQQGQPVQSILYTVYYLIPHLEWFDIRDHLVYDWSLVKWSDCGLATLYAASYTFLFLFLTWIAFRRKSLNT